MSVRRKWGFVRLGILLVGISACIVAGYGLMQTVADLIRMINTVKTNPSDLTAFKVIGRIGHGLAFAGGIVAVVGYVFCLFVPNRRGTLALAIVAVSLGGVNFIFNLLCKLIPMFQDTGILALLMPGYGMVKPSFTSNNAGGAFALSIFVILFYFAEFIIF